MSDITDYLKVYRYGPSVERAFGRLKGRWRILQVPCQFDKILSMVTACCVLHNICEAVNETYTKAWEGTGTEQQMWKDDYKELADEEESLVDMYKTTHDAKQIQAALMRHVNKHRPSTLDTKG